MSSLPLSHALILAASLFVIGLVGVMVRRNLLFMLMGLEIMLNATGLAFVAAGAAWSQPDGQIMLLLILALAGAEVGLGLALVIQLQRRLKTLDVDALSELRG